MPGPGIYFKEMLHRVAAAFIACGIIGAANSVLVCELILCGVIDIQPAATADTAAHSCHEAPAPVDGLGVGALEHPCTHSADNGYSLDANVTPPSPDPGHAIVGRGYCSISRSSSTAIAPRAPQDPTPRRLPLLSSFRV
jgi:hypothetical protein